MKVNFVICPKCLNLIYSRVRHDFRTCECGAVGIDGGQEYTKIMADEKTLAKTITGMIDIAHNSQELYRDWNQELDALGIVKLYTATGDKLNKNKT